MKSKFINRPYDLIISKGASVECEPWFTSSRIKCELDKNVNHKNYFFKIKEPVNQIM